jgi:hypothetical protein
MISYAWWSKATNGPIWQTPRKVARLLPKGYPPPSPLLLPESCVWIDIRKLIPGSNTKQETAFAVKHASFRLVFASGAYFQSPNCLLEWNEIIQQDPAAFVVIPVERDFDYERRDTVLPTGISWKSLVRFPCVSMHDVSARWLLGQLLDQELSDLSSEYPTGVGKEVRRKTNVLKSLMSKHTPAINENWRHTAEAPHCGRHMAYGIMKKLPSVVLGGRPGALACARGFLLVACDTLLLCPLPCTHALHMFCRVTQQPPGLHFTSSGWRSGAW